MYVDNALHEPGEMARLISPTFVAADFVKCFEFEYSYKKMDGGAMAIHNQHLNYLWRMLFRNGV